MYVGLMITFDSDGGAFGLPACLTFATRDGSPFTLDAPSLAALASDYARHAGDYDAHAYASRERHARTGFGAQWSREAWSAFHQLTTN